MKFAAVILAAGQGARMKSTLPKVLHPIAGRPMIRYAVDAVRALGCEPTAVVVGQAADPVRSVVGPDVLYVEQREPLGTGHAVLQARAALIGKADAVIVTYADMPLLRAETLQRLIDLHATSKAAITMLTVDVSQGLRRRPAGRSSRVGAQPGATMGFGRIRRNDKRRVVGVIEESEATPKQLGIGELNAGVYCFDADWLWEHVTRIEPSAVKREYFLTDLVAMAVEGRRKIEVIVLDDAREVVGVNTRVHLADAERLMRERINVALMESGVTMTDPSTVYVEADVKVGSDTVIEPNTHIEGTSRIGANCCIGPNAIIRDAMIGDGCTIIASVVRESVLEEGVHVGPMADLRPGTYLGRDVTVGNFGEVKNSRVGRASHIGHFSYIGDAELGAHVNIGAGTITCNFDGKKKSRTSIGDGAFIGSDTMLVAPVKVGTHARTGAGSVVTRDVPDNSLAVGLPARVIRRLDVDREKAHE